MKQESHTLTMVYKINEDCSIEIEQTTFEDTPIKLTFMSDEKCKYKDAIHYLFDDTDEMIVMMDNIRECIVDFSNKFKALSNE